MQTSTTRLGQFRPALTIRCHHRQAQPKTLGSNSVGFSQKAVGVRDGMCLESRGSAFRTQVASVRTDLSPGENSGGDEQPRAKNLASVLALFLAVPKALKALAKSMSTAMGASLKNADSEKINADIRETVKGMKTFSLVLPLASMSGGNAFLLITKAVSSFIKLYLLLLFLRVLLSWFPTFKWDRNPWIILRQVTDPYLNLFRGLVPPLLGTIDFTPLLGFIILQWLVGALDIGEEDRYW
ncbi:hypothetical protein BSKO_01670 [Bryopsis sp. KO-2023]|nr:hypothetical protein BSKO_01670 [Bryopsis sp. KO-2023]